MHQQWVSDITYVPTREGWLYLMVTLGLFHREIIGLTMGQWITQQPVIDALNMAIKNGYLNSSVFNRHPI